jgi:hypothetical protein
VRRIFIDTEFTNLPWTGHSEMMWVGLADEAGNAWSAINSDVAIDDHASQFTRDVVVPQMTVDEPRLGGHALSEAIRRFCGDVDEFWAWCPTVEDLAAAFGLADAANDAHRRYWDWDLQLLQRTLAPWPDGWPIRLHDLHAAATAAGVTPPANTSAHHPRHDALWNVRVFEMIHPEQI